MEVATRLFAQKGYHRTSVADVCDTCGVGKGVFYWYFDSKEALFNAILAGALHDLRRTQQRAIEPSPDPIERVTAGIEASLDFLAANDDLFNLIDFAGTDAHFSPVVRHGIDVVVDDTTRHLKEAIAQGASPTPIRTSSRMGSRRSHSRSCAASCTGAAPRAPSTPSPSDVPPSRSASTASASPPRTDAVAIGDRPGSG